MGFIDKLFGKKKAQEILSRVDYNLIFDNPVVDGIPVELLNIGLLNVPSGEIVACDPLVQPDALPYNKKVPPGNYPIKVYIAKTEQSGDRYAIAKLEFSSARACKWILALTNEDDISTLVGDNDFLGFTVDAGLGGFFDYKSGVEYNRFIEEFNDSNPDGNIYDDFFATEFKKNATNPEEDGDWINFKLPNSELNITMFHSGYGDGVYPAYWGMTENNEIVSLVIDFMVLLLPDE